MSAMFVLLQIREMKRQAEEGDMDSFSNIFDTYISLYTRWQMDGVRPCRRIFRRQNNRLSEHPAAL
jgi:hypothetical protein